MVLLFVSVLVRVWVVLGQSLASHLALHSRLRLPAVYLYYSTCSDSVHLIFIFIIFYFSFIHLFIYIYLFLFIIIVVRAVYFL